MNMQQQDALLRKLREVAKEPPLYDEVGDREWSPCDLAKELLEEFFEEKRK